MMCTAGEVATVRYKLCMCVCCVCVLCVCCVCVVCVLCVCCVCGFVCVLCVCCVCVLCVWVHVYGCMGGGDNQPTPTMHPY